MQSRYKINLDEAPVNLQLIEEIILARNNIQHPPSIFTIRPEIKNTDLKKFLHPIFVSERETKALKEHGEGDWFMLPTLHITETQLFEAISEIDLFFDWFESQIEFKPFV